MKTDYYMHIPLWVDVFHMARDLPMPRSVYFDHKEYKVTRIISSGEAPPAGAKLPVRKYIVEISGVKKALYHDIRHDMWYSLKKISEEKAKKIRNARGQGFPRAYFRSVIEARTYFPAGCDARKSAGKGP